MSNDSIGKTLSVAILLCLVCSIIVSGAAVMLKPLQQENKLLDKQQNILKAAGLYDENQSTSEQFSKITKQVINIETGEYAPADFDVATYDQRKAKKDPSQSVAIDPTRDIASLKRRAKYAEIYVVNNDQGQLETLILPVSGYGLWSTLYGFIALENDLNTVAGLAFYDHAETPGLGGEVDNPKWKAQWLGKQIFNAQGQVVAKLKKGGVNPAIALEKRHYVDGLSGATLTSNGVSNLIAYWLGDNGFAPLLKNMAGSSSAKAKTNYPAVTYKPATTDTTTDTASDSALDAIDDLEVDNNVADDVIEMTTESSSEVVTEKITEIKESNDTFSDSVEDFK